VSESEKGQPDTGRQIERVRGLRGDTWNLLAGCSPISPGCDHCYAARLASGRLSRHQLYKGLAHDGRWTGQVRLDWAQVLKPLRWRRPRVVFVCSMGDLFHRMVPFDFIDEVLNTIADEWCADSIFIILTARPERILEFWDWAGEHEPGDSPLAVAMETNDALPNVWWGVMAEDQKRADERIPVLLDCSAALRFASCEPLLESVDLSAHIGKLDWVIAGGETGQAARPMHPDWVRSLRDQCCAASVPFFFKAWGEWVPEPYRDWRDSETCMVGSTRMWRHGRAAKQFNRHRHLDGRIWDEMPNRMEITA